MIDDLGFVLACGWVLGDGNNVIANLFNMLSRFAVLEYGSLGFEVFDFGFFFSVGLADLLSLLLLFFSRSFV